MILSLCPNNQCQRSVNNSRSCNWENQGAIELHWSIIELSAAILGQNAYDRIVIMSQNHRQGSVNDFWSCIFDNLTAMECRQPQWTDRLLSLAKMLVMISRPPPAIKHPHSINSFCGYSVCYIAMNCIVVFLNRVIRCQSFQSVFVYNLTNMHAMSYRSEFFACSCTGNIWEPAVCLTVSLLSAVCWVRLPSFLIPIPMSVSKTLNST